MLLYRIHWGGKKQLQSCFNKFTVRYRQIELARDARANAVLALEATLKMKPRPRWNLKVLFLLTADRASLSESTTSIEKKKICWSV